MEKQTNSISRFKILDGLKEYWFDARSTKSIQFEIDVRKDITLEMNQVGTRDMIIECSKKRK